MPVTNATFWVEVNPGLSEVALQLSTQGGAGGGLECNHEGSVGNASSFPLDQALRRYKSHFDANWNDSDSQFLLDKRTETVQGLVKATLSDIAALENPGHSASPQPQPKSKTSQMQPSNLLVDPGANDLLQWLDHPRDG